MAVDDHSLLPRCGHEYLLAKGSEVRHSRGNRSNRKTHTRSRSFVVCGGRNLDERREIIILIREWREPTRVRDRGRDSEENVRGGRTFRLPVAVSIVNLGEAQRRWRD